jgi:hypothetical protein
MAIFSDLELEGILNEAEDERKYKDSVKRNIQNIKDAGNKAKSNIKNNSWIGKKMSSKNESGMQTITFKEDADGNVLESSLDEGTKESRFEVKFGDDGKNKKETVTKHRHYDFEFGLGNRRVRDSFDRKYVKLEDDDSFEESEKVDPEKITRDLTLKATIGIGKEKQDWEENPGTKTGEMIGNIATGGNFLNDVGKKAGRSIGSKVDDFIHKKNRERRKLKEDSEVIYRSPEYNRIIDEFFDFTDRETRKVLLAVNEADQNKILVSLTSKLYDNVVDKVDDIDFGEIEMSKGDIEKLPNFETLHECLNNMARLLIEFKQDTHPVDQIAECISNMIETKDMWKKAYALNVELPMITYNTIVLAIIEATSYMVSMCVEFVKSPSEDTMKIMIDKSALTKSKSHMILKNIESFNSAFRKGQVQKAMWHVIDESAKKKNFVGLGIYGGLGVGAAAVAGIAGLLFCIIPLLRELIFLFYYTRVRVSDFFEVQADLLQVSSYNVENNRLDLTKEERKKIATKQMKTADKFRNASRFIAIKTSEAENKAVKEIKKEDNKKYKVNDVVDELPDSAAASSALF